MLASQSDCRRKRETMHTSSESEFDDTVSQVSVPVDSGSLPSEPPDIRILFASYVYESPELYSADGFPDLDGTGETCFQEGKKANFGNIHSLGKIDATLISPSDESLEGIHVSDKDEHKISFSMEQDDHIVGLKLAPSPKIQLTSDNISGQISPGLKKCCNLHASAEVSKFMSAHGEDYVWKTIGNKDCHEYTLKKGDLLPIIPLDTIDAAVPKGGSCIKASDRRNTGKENERSALSETGFVSVRTVDNKGIAGGMTNNTRVKFGSLGNGIKFALDQGNNGSSTSRKILSETSNFCADHVIMESTGKWSCPRKNKPDLGPPLKQLRLERWVRLL